ncbi:MAG TPA: polymorphic toxin-type HINT domain-containing protein [Allosphingosinicella sp.]|jgi:RHS repeat-associated protein
MARLPLLFAARARGEPRPRDNLSYDSHRRLTSENHTSFGAKSFGYDDRGNRTSLTRGNGTGTSYTPDPVSRLQTLAQTFPAASSNNFTLGFSYNAASQIVGNTRSNDLYNWAGAAVGTTASTPNALNQIAAHGGVNFTYDAKGNLTSDGTRSYTYDAENRLKTAGTAEMYHDPLGRLSFYLGSMGVLDYEGSRLVAELDGANNFAIFRRFVHGPGADEPLVQYDSAGTANRRWLHADERGSIVALSNPSGSIHARNRYDEYGIPAATNVGRFQYTGQQWMPGLNLYSYKGRIYDPKLGRFLQPDPIGYGDGMNRYAYVGGDPVNFVDPLGLKEEPGEEDKAKYKHVTCTGSRIAGACGAGGLAGGLSGSSTGGPGGRVQADWVCIFACGGSESIFDEFGNETIIVEAPRYAWVAWQIGRDVMDHIRGEWDFGMAVLGHQLGEGLSALRDFFIPPLNQQETLPCGCLEAGTLVSTPDGLRPIEDIKVGDLVLALNDKTGSIASKLVTDLIRPERKALYSLQTVDSSGEAETFHATDDHPWRVEGKGWVKTLSLKSGDRIATASGAGIVVTGVSLTERFETTYNLTVADWHTFFVGKDEAIVHNTCPEKGRTFRGGKKSSRDKWYGYNDKAFQRWWHRDGKLEFGRDLDSADEVKQAFDYWREIGAPTPK